MSQRSWLRDLVTSIRFVSLLFGVALILLSAVIVYAVLEARAGTETSQTKFFLFYQLILALSILAGGVTLVHSIARNVTIRLPKGPLSRLPRLRFNLSHGYGFTTALAIGLGATLGSPLFVLVPLNVLQYGILSIGSLIIAASISVVIAHLYTRMYREWTAKGLDCTDGPSFTRNACGRVSLRYFIARFGMWIGNTALAGYSLIIAANYARLGFFNTLRTFVNLGSYEVLVTALIFSLLIIWFVINAFFEKTYSRAIGGAQILLTVILCIILVYESSLLLGTQNRPIESLAAFPSSDITSLLFVLVTNTAYLFLLFFGFQEIQALSADLASKSNIPVLSTFARFRNIDRVTFAKYAMLGSVLIATVINVLYAVAVYVGSPDLAGAQASSVPGVYISRTMFGPWNGLLMATGFIIASLTTFVPTYLASSRHLRRLSSDGFFPASVGRSAWLFSLIFIVVFSLFSADFLVKIIDFGVLVSLCFISLSAVWARKPFWPPLPKDVLPIVAGVTCLLAAGALHFIESNVVLFGIIFILIGYLIFDVFELGPYGSQLFLVVLYVALLAVTGVFARAGTLHDSFAANVSLGLIQATLQASVAVLGVNLLFRARASRRLKRAMLVLSSAPGYLRAQLGTVFKRDHRDAGLDRIVDSWVRLMSVGDKLASTDLRTFELVKRYLEEKLTSLDSPNRNLQDKSNSKNKQPNQDH
ncbi:MAG TPA: APC family permease [Candidatus Bathyarchaeia archaeon]